MAYNSCYLLGLSLDTFQQRIVALEALWPKPRARGRVIANNQSTESSCGRHLFSHSSVLCFAFAITWE